MAFLRSALAVLILQCAEVFSASAPSVCEGVTDPVIRMCYANAVVGQTVYLDTGDIGDRYLGTCPCTINAVTGGTFEITPTQRPADPLCFVQIKFKDNIEDMIFCGTDNSATITRDLSTKELNMRVVMVTDPNDAPTDTNFCIKMEITGAASNMTVSCAGDTSAPTLSPPTVTNQTDSNENSTISGQDALPANMFFLGYMALTSVLYPMMP